MKKATIISIDLAKSIFQILGVSSEGKTLFKRRLNRIKLIEFISQHPACTIVIKIPRQPLHYLPNRQLKRKAI